MTILPEIFCFNGTYRGIKHRFIFSYLFTKIAKKISIFSKQYFYIIDNTNEIKFFIE